jgi:RNA polymerase sigma factor (sigma-70 family)
MKQLKTSEEHNSAGAALYDRFASIIFAYLYRQVASRQDAEDLLLEVFVAALRDEVLFGLSEERQLAWLRRVARNKMIDRYRHDGLFALLPLDQAEEQEDNALMPEQQAERREKYERLYHAIEQLSAEQRQVIRLRYGEGLRLVEIAVMLDRPDSTVRKLLERALQKLRELYEQAERGDQL